jgi:magnesium-transporting ATPase (P-type)
MRAVQASDYAIGEFKFLRRLLLFHGRTNYVRISEMVLYFFYKNFVFTLIHLFFAFLCLSSGQTIIDDWLITFYNMVFTAFPLGARACLDKDVTDDDGEIISHLTPFIYKENKMFPIFDVKNFLISLLRGTIHGIINFLLVIFTLWNGATDEKGNSADLWFLSVVLYTNIISVKFNLF